jgi:prepilin signal peptidase PulO-like enzyme (type II secretory pathway)
MNLFLEQSLPVRTLIIALIGFLYAAAANWGINQLSYFHRHIGPWSKTVPKGSQYSWLDRIPLLGWLRMRRFSDQFGKYFWVRPFLIELLLPLFLAWFYRYEIMGGLLPHQNSMQKLIPALQSQLHYQFLAHAILIWAMCVATFIDFDELLIPDWITVTGTVVGLLGAAFFNGWHLFQVDRSGPSVALGTLHACSPGAWAEWMSGPYGLAVALLCYAGWCFALSDRRWIGRKGWKKAIHYFFARLVRHKIWFYLVVALWVIGSLAILMFYLQRSEHWINLLSALIGMATAGGIVWAVRIVASTSLGMEALGFGDATLMAMIGAYLGWQASLLVFFLAPMTSLLFVLVAWLVSGEKAFPFGPYLCCAAMLVMLFWNSIWNEWAAGVFELGTVLLAILLISLIAMGFILTVWRWIRDRFLWVEKCPSR